MQNMSTSPEFTAKLKVENFPSKMELLNLVDDYLKEIDQEKCYKQIIMDNVILLTFPNPDIAYGLIRKLKITQAKNPLYNHIQASLSLVLKGGDKNYKVPSYYKKREQIKNKSNSKSTNKLTKTEVSNDSTNKKLIPHKSPIKYFNNDRSKILININKRPIRKRVYESIFLEQTPYIDAYNQQMLDRKKNKMLWLNPKGFNSNVGLASSNFNHQFIKNYVSETPSEAPINYNFREIHKERWIGKDTFIP